jgi:ligand-binding sensor domain-containing protein
VTFTPTGTFLLTTRSEQGVVDPSTGRYRPDPFTRPPAPPEDPSPPANLFAGMDYQYLADGTIAGPRGSAAPVSATAADDDAGLWLGTWGYGVGRADLRTLRLEMMDWGLWSEDARAVAVAGDQLVAGGLGDARTSGGLTEIDLRRRTARWLLAIDETGLRSDRVYDLALEGRALWVAGEGGVSRRDARGRWQTWGSGRGVPEDGALSVAVGAGAVWVGTWHGAVAVAADTLRTLAIPRQAVVVDVGAGDRGAWFATSHGAYVYRGRWPEGRLARLEHPEGRLAGQVDAVGIMEDEVWFAGPFGLVGYDAERGGWLPVPRVGPFVPGEVSDIAVDAENLWLATGNGVLRLIRETGIWHRYGPEDGLISRTVRTVVLQGTTAWFGTDRGLTRFDYRMRRKTP